MEEMYLNKRKSLAFLSVLFFLSLAFGCIPLEHRVHPEFEVRSRNIKTPGLIPPDVKIYEFTAGGVHELMDDWSYKGKENILNSLMENFKEKGFEVNALAIDEDIEEEMEEINAIYRAVSTCIYLHTYGPYPFPEKKKNFNYSIGSIDKILEKYDSDALIFVYGSDEKSTGGRTALKVVGFLAGALVGTYVGPRADITSVSIALVEPSGTILWYCIRSRAGGYDLTKQESVSMFLGDILTNFPRLER
jgi:hypothetical protein